MGDTRKVTDMLFGAGFKVGLIMAFAAVFMMYLPLIQSALNPLLVYIGFWEALRNNPQWVRVFVLGVILMLVAVVVSAMRGWIEEFVEALFGRDEPHIPRSSA